MLWRILILNMVSNLPLDRTRWSYVCSKRRETSWTALLPSQYAKWPILQSDLALQLFRLWACQIGWHQIHRKEIAGRECRAIFTELCYYSQHYCLQTEMTRHCPNRESLQRHHHQSKKTLSHRPCGRRLTNFTAMVSSCGTWRYRMEVVCWQALQELRRQNMLLYTYAPQVT